MAHGQSAQRRKLCIVLEFQDTVFQCFSTSIKIHLSKSLTRPGTQQRRAQPPSLIPGFSEYCLCYQTVQRRILPGYEPKVQITTLTYVFEWRLLQRQHRSQTGQGSSATKGITLSGESTSLMSSRRAAVSKQLPTNFNVSLTNPTTPLQATMTPTISIKISQGLASASTPISLPLQHYRMISKSEQSSYMLHSRKQERREEEEKRKEERKRRSLKKTR